MRRAEYLWDSRPGKNVEKITAHGLTTDMWEQIYERAPEVIEDKDDSTVYVAAAKVSGQIFRIVFSIEEGDVIVPITVSPITGFSADRRLKRKQS